VTNDFFYTDEQVILLALLIHYTKEPLDCSELGFKLIAYN
jgi:hypothetical protein